MTPAHKSELLEVLAELAQRYPHWRFGQLVANVADWADQSVWDAEDQQLVEAARLHLAQAADTENAVRS
jgi:hypothetical protein